MIRNLTLVCALAALVVASILAPYSPAAEPCGPPVSTDPTGDTHRGDPFGLGGGPPGNANMDLTAIHFFHGDNKLTARMVIDDLAKTLPPGAASITWYAQWVFGDTEYWVGADSDGSTVTYSYGTYDAGTGAYASEGETTGKFTEGKNGTIDIVVPGSSGGKLASKLTGIYATSFELTGVLLSPQDRAPDDGGGSYTVAACPTAGATPTPTATATPAPGATPTPTPTPTPMSSPPVSSGTPTGGAPRRGVPGQLPVTVLTKRIALKKARKRIALKLRSRARVEAIEAALYQGKAAKPRIFARGGLAQLDGRGTLRLKTSKKLKKGSYTLYLAGRTSAGNTDKTYSLKAR